MQRTLGDLDLGFRGDLTMSQEMEDMTMDLFLDTVPRAWRKRPYDYPSMRSLSGWLANLQLRITQLQDWCSNPLEIPRVTWISGLFNPQRFLTAVMQTTARNNALELDKLVISSLVLKRQIDDIEG